MRLSEILTRDRVSIEKITSKSEAIKQIACLLGADLPPEILPKIVAVLEEREADQSTGIGDGVAIPHAFLNDVPERRAALLVVPDGVDFNAIDKRSTTILLGVIAPKKQVQEQFNHLWLLTRLSKLLRESALRHQIIGAPSAEDVYRAVCEADEKLA